MGLRYFVSRLGERRFDFVDNGGRLGLHEIFQVVGQWVRDGDQWQPGCAEHLGFGPAKGPELVAADDHRGNAGMLEFYAVVDTPRRAAASIGDGQHHRVTGAEPIHDFGR